MHYIKFLMKSQKSKKNATETRITVTELHNEKLEAFKKKQDQIPDKEKKLLKLKTKYEKKKAKKTNRKQELRLLSNEINQLTEEIESLKRNDEFTEYLLDVQSILYRKTIEEDQEIEISEDTDSANGISQFLVAKTSNKKQQLLNEYLVATGGCPESDCAREYHYHTEDFICSGCDSRDKVIDRARSMIICSECGLSQEWQDPNLPQWSNEANVTKQYRYKREKYFENHLNRFQGKEHVNIPPELIQQILQELDKRRINDVNDINYKLIKNILRHLGQSSYYDNINTIIYKVTGKKPPKLAPDLERRLILMFNQTIEPFEKWKHLIKNRNNFLSYPYIISKLLEIVEPDEEPYDENIKNGIKDSFKMLNSDEKSRIQEKVFEKICKELGWPFKKSV